MRIGMKLSGMGRARLFHKGRCESTHVEERKGAKALRRARPRWLGSARAERLPSVRARAGLPGRGDRRRRRPRAAASTCRADRRRGRRVDGRDRREAARARAPRSSRLRGQRRQGDRAAGGPRRGSSTPMRPTSPSWTPTGSTTPRTCRGCSPRPASGEDFVIGSRMADARRDPGLPLPHQRDRQPDPVADDGPRGRGRAVRATASSRPDVLRRLALNARGYIIETEILLKAAPHVKRFRHVPVRAIYGGPSHYRPFRDTWVISWGAVYYKVFETGLTATVGAARAARGRGPRDRSTRPAEQAPDPTCGAMTGLLGRQPLQSPHVSDPLITPLRIAGPRAARPDDRRGGLVPRLRRRVLLGPAPLGLVRAARRDDARRASSTRSRAAVTGRRSSSSAGSPGGTRSLVREAARGATRSASTATCTGGPTR